MEQLPPSRILDRTNAVLNELRIYPAWTASLDRATARMTPRLVTSIAPASRKGGKLPDYFIVEIQRGNGVSARFAHHAETGEFLEAESVGTREGVLPEYVDPMTALASEMPAASNVAPQLVWRPCLQSATRFLPFWRLQIGERPLYLRADGVRFDDLTVNQRG